MGKLIIFSAPSGSGKTTIIKEILKENYPLEFSISACNRNPRNGETHGKDYYFLSTEEFQTRIKNDEFIEWEEVYQGRYYGTLQSEPERIWAKQQHVLFDLDVKGGLNLKQKFGDKALAIFIQPPSVEELRKRLEGRATDNAQEIDRRIAKAQEELSHAPQFDVVITNNDLKKAVTETHLAIKSFLDLL